MIQLLVDVRADGEVDEDEAKTLLKAMYNLALLSSDDTLAQVSEFVSNSIFSNEDEEDEDIISLFDVISSFRKELKLGGLDSLYHEDVKTVEKLLLKGFDKSDFLKIRQFLSTANEQILSIFESRLTSEIFDSYDFSYVFGQGDSSRFVITSPNINIDYQVIIESTNLDKIRDLQFMVFGAASTNSDGISKLLPKNKAQLIANAASRLGFEITEKDEEGDWHFSKTYPINNDHNKDLDDSLIEDAAQQIADDILGIEGFGLKD